MGVILPLVFPSIAYLAWNYLPRLARLCLFVSVIEVIGMSIHFFW